MTARDFAANDYYLALLQNQQISWDSVQKTIVGKILGGFFISFILFLLSFVVLIIWSRFVRKTPSYSESQASEKLNQYNWVILVVPAVVGLVLLYYAVIGNKGYIMAVEAISIVAVAYFSRNKYTLIVCYVLVVAFLYLLVKYTVSIEGNRLIVICLYTAAASTWSLSCLLWKMRSLLDSEPTTITKNDSGKTTTVSGVIDDKFYKIAFDEITVNKAEPTLWAKAFANAEGNQDKAKALYIKYRVEKFSVLKANESKLYSSTVDLDKNAEDFDENSIHLMQNNKLITKQKLNSNSTKSYQPGPTVGVIMFISLLSCIFLVYYFFWKIFLKS